MNRLDLIVSGAGNDSGSIVAPRIRCADGFDLSVQASWGHYCLDADGRRPKLPMSGPFSDSAVAPMPYTAVEVGFPSARPEPWRCSTAPRDGWEWYAESPEDPTGTVYGYVPVQMVLDLIAAHGGEAS